MSPLTKLFILSSVANICLLVLVNAHSHPAYNHDENGLGYNADWQSVILDDSTKINVVSYPGTHDTMADDNDGDAVDCQDSTLTKQLEAGVRALDIRCRAYGGVFTIHHGPYYLSVNFGDVLNECKNFLNNHPNEYILMRVKQEYSEESDAYFTSIFQTYWDNPSYSSYFYKTSNYNTIPTVGQVRGKIVILQNWAGSDRFGLDWGSNDIQDEFKLTTNWDLYGKWEAIKTQLNNANNAAISNTIPSDKFFINFLSASTGSFPYFVASGHSNPATGAPRLATGLTTPGWSSSYPDFPRVSCFIGICTIAFEGTNILTFDYIANNNIQFVGMVFIDFPGQELIDRIINLNNDFCLPSDDDIDSLTYPSMDCYQNSNYENDWDGSLDSSNSRVFFNGLYSAHDNHREDRRFRFRYCKPSGITASTSGSTYLSETNYDEEWYRGCSGDAAISRAQSYHDNHREDRQWTFRCTPLPSQYQFSECVWTDYLNDWDAVLDYDCPNDGLIRGIESKHDNGKEDRRWRFECCRVTESTGHPTMDCWKSDYVNGWDGSMNAYNSRVFFNGAESYHDNGKEDRRFKFRYCKPSGVTVSTSGSITLPYTWYDDSWYRGCGGNSAISKAVSNHDNGREDRRWEFRCTPLPNDYILTSCSWTGYVNAFDGGMNYDCSGDGVIRTINSYHDNGREDRRFRFECCRVIRSIYMYPAMITSWSDYENAWDGSYDNRQSSTYLCGQDSSHDNGREDRRYKWKKCRVDGAFIGATKNLEITSWDGEWEKSCSCVNGGNAAMTGVSSSHDNGREDRTFTFQCGSLVATYKVVNCGWTGFVNNYDERLNFECPNNGVIRSVWSKHDNGREDRIWKFECCQVATAVTAGNNEPSNIDFVDRLIGFNNDGIKDYGNKANEAPEYMMYFVNIIIGLLVVNIICFGIYCCRRMKRNNSHKHQPVSIDSADSETDIENV